jgi:hypothetical protein
LIRAGAERRQERSGEKKKPEKKFSAVFSVWSDAKAGAYGPGSESGHLRKIIFLKIIKAQELSITMPCGAGCVRRTSSKLSSSKHVVRGAKSIRHKIVTRMNMFSELAIADGAIIGVEAAVQVASGSSVGARLHRAVSARPRTGHTVRGSSGKY